MRYGGPTPSFRSGSNGTLNQTINKVDLDKRVRVVVYRVTGSPYSLRIIYTLSPSNEMRSLSLISKVHRSSTGPRCASMIVVRLPVRLNAVCIHQRQAICR